MLEQFLDYRSRGFSVIPVKTDKKPYISTWLEFQKRIATEEEIKQWLTNYPDAQIAIITGEVSNLAVIDIDIHKGGDATPYAFDTTTVRSGSGGIHLWFKHLPGLKNSTGEIAPHVDVRASGGYILVPPSKNENGQYTFIKEVKELLPFPMHLIKAIGQKNKTINHPDIRANLNNFTGVDEGGRNNTMTRYIGSLLNKFHPYEWESRAWPEFCATNQKNKPPLDEAELRKIFDSIVKADINSEGENKGGTPNKAKTITSLLLNMGVTPFLDQYKTPHVALNGDGSIILPIRSSDFGDFIAAQLFKNDITAGKDTIEQVKNSLSGKALFEKTQYPLSVRVAKDKNKDYWYDLGEGRLVKINENGWAVSNKPPILFRNLSHQIPQPLPVNDGSLDDLFELINIKDEQNKLLLKVMTVAGFISGFPHPVIVLNGQKGSAKSTCLRLLKSVIDPSQADLLAPINDMNILTQTISHHWLTCFDNLSFIRQEVSDSFCRICTGGATSTRQLYKDDSNIVRRFKSMVAINGISNVIVNPDLFDRSIMIELKPIDEEHRLLDEEINTRLEKIKPGVLGACLDAAAKAIKIKSSIELKKKVRMADFAVWGCAIAEAIGEDKGKFLQAFQLNYDNQDEIAIEDNPLAQAIEKLIAEKDQAGITATSETILQELNNLNKYGRFAEKNDRAWPANNRIFGRKFFVLIPLLEKIGLKITNTRRAERFKSIIPTDKFWKRQELIKKENQQDADQITEPEPPFTDEPNKINNVVNDVNDVSSPTLFD